MAEFSKDLKELTLLFEISLALNKSKDIKDVLPVILKMLANYIGLERGTIALLNRNKSEIFIEEACGLSNEEKARGKYKVGEGIIGKVVETGMPVIIPRISEEPNFLDRTAARQKIDKSDFSFICVPVKHGEETIGTLSVDRVFKKDEKFDYHISLISIIGSMIAQALRARQEELEELERLQEENEKLHLVLDKKFRPANIVGNSQAMALVYELIGKVAPTNATVLITGQSGVGKEMIANAIHFNSPRAGRSYVKVNCSALPESLIESELFGHERGAFTGADKQKKGRFELANGGTIFLDEIGELPMNTQVRLLRILQEMEFERVGGTETIKVDIRVVAATNRNLEKLIEEGKFREDLFYRLNVFPVYIPPLKERKSDIPALIDHFIEKYNKINNLSIQRISTSAIDMIMSYHWPGNVRELENCIERASILSTNGVIYGFHLPPTLQTPEATGKPVKGPLMSVLSKVEKELIRDTLKLTRGNVAQASELLGITERMLGTRISKYQLEPKSYKTNGGPE